MCFKNSTIIALDDPDSKPESATRRLRPRDDKSEFEEGSDEKKPPYRPKNCNDCSKQFCLNHNLPICKGAKEDDVSTTCFREYRCTLKAVLFCLRWLLYGQSRANGDQERDSAKDQAVVFIFIIVTTGLLVWALLRPWIDDWVEV